MRFLDDVLDQEQACEGTFSVLGSLGFAQHRLAMNLSALSHADEFGFAQQRPHVRHPVRGHVGSCSGALEYCNAGHNTPCRLNRDIVVTIEGAKSIILGIRPEAA